MYSLKEKGKKNLLLNKLLLENIDWVGTSFREETAV